MLTRPMTISRSLRTYTPLGTTAPQALREIKGFPHRFLSYLLHLVNPKGEVLGEFINVIHKAKGQVLEAKGGPCDSSPPQVSVPSAHTALQW